MSAESYLREISSIDIELKRLSALSKSLREQKRRAQNNLHQYMVSHGLEKVGDGKNAITIKKCAPPQPRRKVKPKKERKADAIELFRDVGIPNPEEFYEQWESTQKSTQNPNDEEDGGAQRPKSKGKKDDFDDALGF